MIELNLSRETKTKAFLNETDETITIISLNDISIEIKLIRQIEKDNKWHIEKQHAIKLKNILIEPYAKPFDFVMSKKSGYLGLLSCNNIIYLKPLKNTLVGEIKLTTNAKTASLVAIDDSDDMLVYDGAVKLKYIYYDDLNLSLACESNIFDAFNCTNLTNRANFIAFTNSFNETKELVVLGGKNGLKDMKEMIKIELKKDNHTLFMCFTPNCEYLVTYDSLKILRLYRVNDSQNIAEVPLVHSILALDATNSFVVMISDDQRIICYLIVDPKRQDHLKELVSLRKK